MNLIDYTSYFNIDHKHSGTRKLLSSFAAPSYSRQERPKDGLQTFLYSLSLSFSLSLSLKLGEKMASSLRSKDHQIAGSASPLPENVLPTKNQILKRLQLSKETGKLGNEKGMIPVTQIIKPVIGELVLLWGKATIPTISYRGIERALTKFEKSCNKKGFLSQN